MKKKATCGMAALNPSRAYFVRGLHSLVEIILLDHSYSKPWSAHPEASKARPLKTLFLPKSEESEVLELSPDLTIDVCEQVVSPASTIVYDSTKAKTVMSECEKHVTTVSSKRTPDTWEEQICRNGWGPKQNSLFDKVIKVLSTLRLARLAYEQTTNEPVKRRIATDKATKRFRQILCSIEWDPRLTAWLHATLVDGLSIPLLACYLDVLQTLRAKAPSLVDRMVATPVSQRRGPAANAEALSLLLKRPWDPSHGLVTRHKTRKLPGSPLLLIVPSGPTTSTGSGTSSKRTRFWHNQLSVLGKVVPVTMHTSNGGSGVSISQCLDHIIGAVRTKVLELRSHFPNRPVVLIGWSVGALVSCQVALMESVCAVVCLGFPLTGVDGVRGDIEDPLLELKTPTLFVIGSNSCLNSQEDIEEVRERIKAETSLLVVGGADEQLRLTRAKKKQEGLTQSMVDRLIMDQIGEFLGNVLTSMNNSMQQRNDLSDVDESEIKKKKRKRSISRDLSAEMSLSTCGQTKGQAQGPRKSQKGDSTKTVLKIPVGGTLGALSGVRSLSQPSPAKRPRTSKSRAAKANTPASNSMIRVTGALSGALPVGGIKQQVSVPTTHAVIQGLQMSASNVARQVPLSNISGHLPVQTGQGFISLAAKGGSNIKEGVSQSYMTLSGSGSPSIITTGSGSVQYVIKPQSLHHLPLPLGVVSNAGSAVSKSFTASQAVGASSASGGVRYTTLAQSPASPFTSVFSLKGNTVTSQGTPITPGSTVSVTRPQITMTRPTSSGTLSRVSGTRVVPASVLSHVGALNVNQRDGKTFMGQVLTSLPQHMAVTSAQSRAQMSPTSLTRTVPSTVQSSASQALKGASGVSQLPVRAQGTVVRASLAQGVPSPGSTSTRTTAIQQGVQPTTSTRLLPGQIPATVQLSGAQAFANQLAASVQISNARALARQTLTSVQSSNSARPSAGQIPTSVHLTVTKAAPGQVSATVIAQLANSAKVLAGQAARPSTSQIPSSVQISGVRSLPGHLQSGPGSQLMSQLPAAIQLAAAQASQSGRTVNLNLPLRVAVSQGTVVGRSLPSTSVTPTTTQQGTVQGKAQVLKTTATSVTQVLTGSSRFATANITRPQVTVTRTGVIPSSVIIKGGSPVSVQSVLAGLPPGTRVITSTTADGNVYVVGQVENATARPKIEGTTQRFLTTTVEKAVSVGSSTSLNNKPVAGTTSTVATSQQSSASPDGKSQTANSTSASAQVHTIDLTK